jgi:ATP-dependent exoDNAse (exonuclease V) beta subunit
MSAVAAIIETEQERVERWRVEELLRAGFDPAAAAELATRLDVDLHAATELVDRGCPPELALQILL